MNRILSLILFCILLPLNSIAQEERDSLIVAKIEVVQSENTLTFYPFVKYKVVYHYELDYLLLVKKTDVNKNLSVSQQKGKYTLETNHIESLSTTTINQTSNQKVKAILF